MEGLIEKVNCKFFRPLLSTVYGYYKRGDYRRYRVAAKFEATSSFLYSLRTNQVLFCDYSTSREVGADNVESMHTGPSPFATVDYN